VLFWIVKFVVIYCIPISTYASTFWIGQSHF
jgi:hypothetical protein